MNLEKAVVPQNVILMAFAISPTEGSESGAGWALLRGHLELGNRVVLITTDFELQKLRKSREFSELAINCISVNDSGIIIRNSSWVPFSYQIRHILWNFKLYFVARNLASESESSIFHYATYAGDWNLNVLHFLPKNVRKLWGPVGGAQRIPMIFYRKLGFKGIMEEIIKTSATLLFRIISRKLLSNSREVILCANSATFDFYNRKNNVLMLQNIVLNSTDFQDHNQYEEKGLIFGCGRLLAWKNWQSAIIAMKETTEKVLVIAGDGPYRHKLSKIIRKNDLGHKVKLVGKLTRRETISELAKCESFIFPSLRDSASWALAEALYMQKKIIAIDLPGTRAVLGMNYELIDPGDRNLIGTMSDLLMGSGHEETVDKEFTVEVLADGLQYAISRFEH